MDTGLKNNFLTLIETSCKAPKMFLAASLEGILYSQIFFSKPDDLDVILERENIVRRQWLEMCMAFDVSVNGCIGDPQGHIFNEYSFAENQKSRDQVKSCMHRVLSDLSDQEFDEMRVLSDFAKEWIDNSGMYVNRYFYEGLAKGLCLCLENRSSNMTDSLVEQVWRDCRQGIHGDENVTHCVSDIAGKRLCGRPAAEITSVAKICGVMVSINEKIEVA